MGYLLLVDGGWLGSMGRKPDAEGAKLTQRTQKRDKKYQKNKI
jgi:hypothetical protein